MARSSTARNAESLLPRTTQRTNLNDKNQNNANYLHHKNCAQERTDQMNNMTLDQALPALEFSNAQRLTALRLAFKIIDAFAEPSLTPDEHDAYLAVRERLFDEYSKDTADLSKT